jgi:hypothetical protein
MAVLLDTKDTSQHRDKCDLQSSRTSHFVSQLSQNTDKCDVQCSRTSGTSHFVSQLSQDRGKCHMQCSRTSHFVSQLRPDTDKCDVQSSRTSHFVSQLSQDTDKCDMQSSRNFRHFTLRITSSNTISVPLVPQQPSAQIATHRVTRLSHQRHTAHFFLVPCSTLATQSYFSFNLGSAMSR